MMICVHCSVDKEPCLFSPSSLKSKRPTCRKCVSEKRGHTFGTNRGIRMGQAAILRAEAYGKKCHNFNRAIEIEERRRLLEAREERLSTGKNPY